MGHLQSQWNALSSQPDGAAKQQEQARLGKEMSKVRQMYEQIVMIMKGTMQQQQQQQQQGQQGQQQPQGQPGQSDQSQQQGQDQGLSQGHPQFGGQQQQQQPQQAVASSPSQSMQQLPNMGMNNFAQNNFIQQGQQPQMSQQGAQGPAPGPGPSSRSFSSDNPQHQAQLAVLQAFAQQQQQRQQQQQQQQSQPHQRQESVPAMPQQAPTPSQAAPSPRPQPQQNPMLQQQQSQQQHAFQNQNQQLSHQPPAQPQAQPTPQQGSGLQGMYPHGLSNLQGFTAMIQRFMAQSGTPLPPGIPLTFVGPGPNGAPTNVELNTLFALVLGWGGSAKLSAMAPPQPLPNHQHALSQGLTGWMLLASKLGLAVASPDSNGEGRRDQMPTPAQVPERLRNWYRERLAPFEGWWAQRARQGQPNAGQPGAQQQQQQPQNQAQTPQQPPQQLQQMFDPSQQSQQVQSTPQPSAPTPSGIPPPSPAASASNMSQGSMPAPQMPPTGQPPNGPVPLPPLQQNQQQALQQLAHHLQKMVQENKMTSEEARARFMQASATFRAQQQQQQQMQRQPQQPGQASQQSFGNDGQQQSMAAPPPPPPRAQTPSNASMPVPQSPAAESVASDKTSGSKKRQRKGTGGANAAQASKGGANSSAGKASTPKVAKLEKESTPLSDRDGPQHPPIGQVKPQPSGGDVPHSLSPRTAMRMLQQGNLNPAQQAAALATVRAASQGSISGPDGRSATPSGLQAPTQVAAAAPTKVATPPPPPPPTKYKVEYLPARRDVTTYGGWDLDLVEAELGPLTKGFGKQIRTVRELGVVDIAGLSMSIRSRLETEVSFALNALLILSSGSGVRPDLYHLSLSHCETLFEELLELLEESAFKSADVEDTSEPATFELEGYLTHAQWVAAALREEEDSGGGHGGSPESRRKADIVLTIIDILRNFATMEQNVELLAQHSRLLEIMGRLVSSNARQTTVFTTRELLRLRKDVLFLLSSVAGSRLHIETLSRATLGAFFDLFCSFMLDASDIQDLAGLVFEYPPPQLAATRPPMPRAPKVPHYAEMALDAFARFAQPDANRRALSRVLPESTLLKLSTVLVRMLPCSELDFSLFRTEARLSYIEHVAMCLYDIVFLAPALTKAKLRNSHAWVSAVFRVVKRTSRQHSQQQKNRLPHGGPSQDAGPPPPSFSHNPFSCLIYRLIETLKLVDDSQDLFDQHPLMALGGGAGEASSSSGAGDESSRKTGARRRAPLLAAEEMEVFHILTTPDFDGELARQLTSMVAA